ncbi:MAG: phosphoribosylglycinamide formyltransferase [Candidatus Omnitrophica bacterium]|nr:phosphoribosylglycinamide formyltransferase [Candidatus Omnitrophota bacterium]
MRGAGPVRLAVLASGVGTNLQAIIDAVRAKKLRRVELALVLSDKAHAHAVVRAQRAGIPTVFVHPPGFRTRRAFERDVVRHLKAYRIDLIALAGFMRILSPQFCQLYEDRILNVHPSLLPSFKGSHALRDALAYGVRVTGVTVHFVTAELDGGPVILQDAVRVFPHDTEDTLIARVHRVEHRLYPRAIQMVADQKVKVRKGKAVFKR